MKNYVLPVMLLALSIAYAEGPATGYVEQFGYGSIVVSGTGYPPFNAFDRTRFEYDPVKKLFYVKLGGAMTINMRQILPKGLTLQRCLDAVVQEKGKNLAYRSVDVQFWSIWASHDAAGNRLDDASRPWPAKTGDIPRWDPVVECYWEQQERYGGDTTSGFRWDSIGPDESRREKLKAHLANCRPGQKLYVIFRVGYAYRVPAGLAEEVWDSRENRWVRRVSTGAEGYVLSDPISAATIELR
ncbi:MAG TPA: hypothetical protein PKN50_16525 [Spirochaetota bacterium]|jgi:hypothetical protein|nr:hypothetical protein [Spirochaetota bacterium]HPV43410.1 hypothetical protein [Spirochaetota bacterium]